MVRPAPRHNIYQYISNFMNKIRWNFSSEMHLNMSFAESVILIRHESVKIHCKYVGHLWFCSGLSVLAHCALNKMAEVCRRLFFQMHDWKVTDWGLNKMADFLARNLWSCKVVRLWSGSGWVFEPGDGDAISYRRHMQPGWEAEIRTPLRTDKMTSACHTTANCNPQLTNQRLLLTCIPYAVCSACLVDVTNIWYHITNQCPP